MRKSFGPLIAFFLVPLAARAQDEVIKDYSPIDFERFVKAELKKGITKEKGAFGFRYKFKGLDLLQADFYVQRKFVLFQIKRPITDFNKEITLAKINEWNDRNAVYTRVFRRG